MIKSTVLAVGLSIAALSAVSAPSFAQNTMKTEAAMHPRIAKAIRELEDAIKYLEAAPHDFGGHKAKAIADSRAAVVQLREALKYREIRDNKKM